VTITAPIPATTDQPGRPDPLDGMRVVRLQARNFKRLVAVDITPDPDRDVVVLSGANGMGKSSVLDAIWAVCANAQTARSIPHPIRHGTDTARVQLDLGELIVTRTWTEKGTRLTVEGRDGGRMRNPQTVLDCLLGSLSFDPLTFAGMRERDQVAELLRVLNLPEDPAVIDSKRAEIFERRTEVNRDVRRLAAQLDGLPADPAAPDAEVTISEALANLTEARAQVERHRADEHRAEVMDTRIAEVAQHINRLEEERRELGEARFALCAQLDQSEQSLPDLDALQADVVDLEQRNMRARAAATRRKINAEHAARVAESDALTVSIGSLDETKRTLLAEATMPLPGLGFADDGNGLTHRGVPLAQCCSSERLKVSIAVAMAANPRLRVIRVTDGSLLDSDSMRLLEAMAAEHGCQVWVEVVDESGAVGIVIEDGAVTDTPGSAK
jgi:hypothetical protein